MTFDIVLKQVQILFIILGTGYAGGKFGILDSNGTKKLSEVLLYISSPMLVLSSFLIEYSRERLINIIWVVVFSVSTFIIAIYLSKLIYGRFSEKTAVMLRYTAIFSNCGYIGLPLMKAVYGDEGAFYGAFYVVIFQIFLWTYGYIMFGTKDTKGNTIKRVLTRPTIIAVFIGTIVFLFQIPIPLTVGKAIKAVGDMTMPLSMLIVGGVMSTAKLTAMFNDWKVYLSSSVRLLFMPVLAFLISKLAGVPSLPAKITVTALAMPVAANTTIFSEMFDKDSVFASKCVAVSSLLSIITIPLIIGWVASYV
ncbi:MAG: AEC family transporter [Clostridiaceae bacterium]|nr:AEC family transporter [Clostridiaceae bacterium]